MTSFPSFSEFFRALWGYDPFPWQQTLAEKAAGGEWPQWITLPTGTGKTSVLDIAVYALAKQASQPESKRTAPVRIIFAVNRRIVVDEAFERARKLALKLANPSAIQPPDKLATGDTTPEGELPLFQEIVPSTPSIPSADAIETLTIVANSLRKLTHDSDASPLEAYPLRGGTFTDRSWARSAFQPLILSTTLDQLGSRLLFRGYGVTDGSQPIQAALLANDALLILDEAHTAGAFAETLQAVANFRLLAREPLDLPFQSLQLTATPPAGSVKSFELTAEDRKNPIIQRRLCASKPFELHLVEGAKGKPRHKKLAAAMAEKACQYHQEGHRRILIVVNRIATAQELYEKLNGLPKSQKPNAAIELLTGRLRPLDRDQLVEKLSTKHQLKSDHPTDTVPPLILIATQTIEVGADFDFDALITELAPLDNLRQRFGRLNRYGRNRISPATIVAADESVSDEKEDAIYGAVLPDIWDWLNSLGENPETSADFGLDTMARQLPADQDLTALLAPSSQAPVLLPTHLDLFCQTSPQPQYSPDPSLYIHGPQRDFPQVGIVLRDDLANEQQSSRISAMELLAAAPPLATEAATVPLYLAQEWLHDSTRMYDDSGDAPMARPTSKPAQNTEFQPLPIWRNNEPLWLTEPANLQPGDVLILPTERRKNIKQLMPVAETAITDQYETAYLTSRDHLHIRFTPATRQQLASDLPEPSRTHFLTISEPCFATTEEDGPWSLDLSLWIAALPVLAAILAEHLPPHHYQKKVWQYAAWTNSETRAQRSGDDWKISRISDLKPGVILANRSRVGFTQWPLEPDHLGHQGNAAARAISLEEHSSGVTRRTAKNSAGLPSALHECLRLAAQYHDYGKLDLRFQAILYQCSYQAAAVKAAINPLAKSPTFYPRAVARRIREELGLPTGFPHALVSTAMAALSPLKDHKEAELIFHLIASHHGQCRAFPPVVIDQQPEPIRTTIENEIVCYPGAQAPCAHLADGVTDRFWNLTRRFGWWGLAYLETVLRLADQAESANPS